MKAIAMSLPPGNQDRRRSVTTPSREQDRRRPNSALSWKRLVLPTEHGGWGFLGEPIVLGLLVAASWPGVLIALAAVAGFLARQPLKLLVADRRKGKRYPRTVLAERWFAGLALAAAAAVAAGVMLAQGPALLALGLAAPLAAITLALDLDHRSRATAAELAAPVALGGVAAAMALAAGETRELAFGLWAVLALRAIPSILYVRARLRLERAEAPPLALPLIVQGLALLAAALLARVALLPWLGVAAIAVLGLRAVLGLSPRRLPMTPKQVGISELVLGAMTIGAVAAGLALGL